ncbi:alpha/beta fold hydrolase [Flavobacteriaceae bacterium GF1]
MGAFKVFQEKLIFLPSKLNKEYQFRFDTPFQELFLDTADGAQLNVLHFKAEHPQGVIVYFHGNAGDLSRWGLITEQFVHNGWDVLIMDYRTYGKSTGDLSEENLHRDAQMVYDYAKSGFSEENIVVYGRSLGCAMATKLASANGPQQLILETPFYSLEDMARRRFPFLPAKWLLEYRFENNANIGRVSCPITIFQGTADNVVPYESAFELYQLIAHKESHFVVIDGGGHNNLSDFKLYHSTITQLLGSKNVGGKVTVPPVTNN